ncbi:SDR family NAD(P)-dependent oxidoreductase [Nocardioides sp. cx-173]|uniref:SDR family NAD(P)-dependent oxidoreductase n=1 Tax=Nocardioides sp. cx-173 TaxID=2898796 RepID=UPI001E54A091|nr:SDR family NAD(P)-dependent oxidoreductase [Nocardioides sp. cx-173]MCD4524262.1 SDR family NAD(P)-dependent oxidoreductase [Nocardioides sp. cx-173]UGB41654.1 SDR family NAD(P)-dependent oxidoreductase [Nocardioides sp. cx-173]
MQVQPGDVAVVTGGASGIGLALAAEAATRGLQVVIADLHDDALAAAAEELRGAGAEVTTVVADVARAADVDLLARTAFGLGAVRLLCSNAGIVRVGRAWELSAADWERIVEVNFMATVHLVRAFVPRLIDGGVPAHLLVTGSMASVTARAGISPYVATKHGLLGLCESLHYDLAAESVPIGVTLLMPGLVTTGMAGAEDPDAITAGEVAAIAFAAMARGQLTAFTHPQRIPDAEGRFEAITAQRAPWPPTPDAALARVD